MNFNLFLRAFKLTALNDTLKEFGVNIGIEDLIPMTNPTGTHICFIRKSDRKCVLVVKLKKFNEVGDKYGLSLNCKGWK